MSETPETIQAWLSGVRQQLGVQRRHSAGEIMERVSEEWAEFEKAETTADAVMELADVAIVLMSSPEIMDAVAAKMAINRARTWQLGANGMIYHVKPEVTA